MHTSFWHADGLPREEDIAMIHRHFTAMPLPRKLCRRISPPFDTDTPALGSPSACRKSSKASKESLVVCCPPAGRLQRSADWIKADCRGAQGRVSASYATPRGDCD